MGGLITLGRINAAACSSTAPRVASSRIRSAVSASSCRLSFSITNCCRSAASTASLYRSTFFRRFLYAVYVNDSFTFAWPSGGMPSTNANKGSSAVYRARRSASGSDRRVMR